MSRPPKDAVTWFPVNDDFPRGKIVLTTNNPGAPGGMLARWYRRRQFRGGRWLEVEHWVNPVSLVPLDPQPTHWRPDPDVTDWKPDMEAFTKASAQ